MSMEYIRKMYNVPAKRGGRVCYHGGKCDEYGTIISAGNNLRVRMDDGKKLNFHPTWKLEYLPHIHVEPRAAIMDKEAGE